MFVSQKTRTDPDKFGRIRGLRGTCNTKSMKYEDNLKDSFGRILRVTTQKREIKSISTS